MHHEDTKTTKKNVRDAAVDEASAGCASRVQTIGLVPILPGLQAWAVGSYVRVLIIRPAGSDARETLL